MSAFRNFTRPTISVEYFPPKGLPSERALMTGAHALRRFDLACQTITFGAGGSGAEGSFDWALRLQGLNEIPTAAHIALVHFTRETLVDYVEDLWAHGIKRLVVLRGDGDGDLAGFQTVAETIGALKEIHPFDISVAAYPEVHPKAESLQSDLDVLLEKQTAGADRALTQYFFDNEDFYRFRGKAEKSGFHREIVPGVIPITNFQKIKEFSTKCGAKVPEHFETLFAAAGDDKARQTDVARSIVEAQVRDLAQNGVHSLHIYSLNRVDLTADAIRAFQAEFDKNVEPLRPAMAG